MREFFKKVKILYDNKKYRNLVILGFYGVFFTFVILIMQSNARTNLKPIDKQIPKTYANIESYSYKYIIHENDVNTTIEGIRYKQQERFIYNNNIYYVIEEKLYQVEDNNLVEISDDLLPLKLLKLNNVNLDKVIKAANKDYVITNEVEVEQYTISVADFGQFYDELISNNTSDKIFIKVSKDNDDIKTIEIDFAKYINSNNYRLVIEYDNYDKIDSLEIPYKIKVNEEIEG